MGMVVLLAAALGVMPAPVAYAADITVDNPIDENDSSCSDGDCSLRDAIETATAGQEIDFNVTGTITLTLGQLDIDKDLTITGPGEDSLAISGNNTSRVFDIGNGTAITITGVTIKDGLIASNGGGLNNGNSSPTLINVTFINNTVTGSSSNGGGMYNGGGSPTLTNVTFIGNSSSDFTGGGMASRGGSPVLTNVTFINNTAVHGGGVYNRGSRLTLINVTFSGNTGTSQAGGMRNYEDQGTTLTNVTFSGNSTDVNGGGVANGSNSDPTMANCIFWGNSASGDGDQIYNDSSTPAITYSLVQGGCPSGSTCSNSIYVNPLFVDADGPDDTTGTLDDNLRLQPTSPAIDAGNNLSVTVTTDLDGNPRRIDIPTVIDTGNGAAPIVDMGAYETNFILTKSATPTTPVNPGQTVTFTLAYTNLSTDNVTGLVISDTVPVSVTNVISTYNGATITATPGITYAWTVEDLSEDEWGVITITSEISPGLPGGVFTNTVRAMNTVGNVNFVATAPITVNHAPVADAGSGQAVGNGVTVDLDGSGSNDPVDNHLPLTYRWTQTSTTGSFYALSSSATISKPTFTAPGAYTDVITFTLTVTDALGRPSTPDDVVIIVESVAVTGTEASNSSTTTLGCKTSFTATIDKGSSVTYTWDFDDGVVLTDSGTTVLYNNYINHVYTTTGAMARICGNTVTTFTAVVTASNKPTDTQYIVPTTTIVTITNKFPIADAGPPQIRVIDSLVTLDGSGSYDPDSTLCGSNVITGYHWEQIVDTVVVTLSDSSAVQPSFTAPSPPTMPTVLTFTLTVTDSGCLVGVATTTVTIIAPVGGHTKPASTPELLRPWLILIAMVGAAAAIVFAALRRRTDLKRQC